MKIAIISDTHDNLATLGKAVNWMKKNDIEEIIHCGDICSPETLRELSKMFGGKIHIVFGNVDDEMFLIAKKAPQDMPNVILYGEAGEIEIKDNPPSPNASESRKIAFCHRPKFAKELAATGQYDLVFFGHTHQPWEEKMKISCPPGQKIFPKKEGECRLINPGNLSNMLYKASFAVYDTKSDKLELKIVDIINNL